MLTKFQLDGEMPFSIFKTLFAEAKRLKLKYAFEKINNKFSEFKWIFKCCWNEKFVKDTYYNTIDMVINTRGFLKYIFEGIEDIDEKPACFNHKPHIWALDYLVTDFQLLLDLILKALESRVIYDHDKFDVLFELAHALYNLLRSFHTRYVSRVYNKS